MSIIVGDISFQSIMLPAGLHIILQEFGRCDSWDHFTMHQLRRTGRYLSAVHGVRELLGESLVVVRMKV